MEESSVIVEMYDQMLDRLRAGDRDGAFSLLRDRFSDLPEDVQGQLLTLALEDAIDTELRAEEGKEQFFKKGIETIQALEALKAELEKEQKSE